MILLFYNGCNYKNFSAFMLQANKAKKKMHGYNMCDVCTLK